MGTDLLGIGEAVCDIACEKGFTEKLNFIRLNKYTEVHQLTPHILTMSKQVTVVE